MEENRENATFVKKKDKSVEPTLIFKIRLVGDAGVGKTSTIIRFVDDIWLDNNYVSTIGVDFKLKLVELDQTCIKMQIWDTCGGERFRCLSPSMLRGLHGALLVFDITNMQSFENLKNWASQIDKDVVKVLLGNKCDLEEERAVSYEKAKKYADQLDIPYLETSAKTATNVDEAFKTITTDIMKLVDAGVLNADIRKPTVVLKAKEPRCCMC